MAASVVRLAGGCSSDVGLIGRDSGADGSAIMTGPDGATDANRDKPGDVPQDQGPVGPGGAPGIGGATGAGGALGLGGAPGTGGTGMGGGVGAGGTGVGGIGIGGTGVGGTGVGGAGVGGMGIGGTGTGGTGVGGTGVGGATGGADAGAPNDGAIDAAPGTLTRIWNEVLRNNGPEPEPGCLGCHNGNNANIPNYTSVDTAFATLVGVASTSCTGRTRVVRFSAVDSVLYQKLRAGSGFQPPTNVCAGTAMPRGNRAITIDQLRMIESWINAGAPNN